MFNDYEPKGLQERLFMIWISNVFINTNFLLYFQYKEELYGRNYFPVKLRLSFDSLELFLK